VREALPKLPGSGRGVSGLAQMSTRTGYGVGVGTKTAGYLNWMKTPPSTL